MVNKYCKGSLKKRITRAISILNFFNLAIMLIAMMITLGIVFKISSIVIVENAASHMSSQIKEDYLKGRKDGKIAEEFTTVTPYYENIFNKLGQSYKLFPPSDKDLTPQQLTHTEVTKIKDMNYLIEYNIWNSNNLIYNSLNQSQIKGSKKIPIADNWLIQKINTETSQSVVIDNKELFVINVKLNPGIIFGGYVALIIICLVIFLIILIISKVIANMLSNVIVKPLLDLETKMKELADGNIEAAIKTEIKFKKPIGEVENLTNYTNIIMSRMGEYVDALANQNTELEAQNLTLLDNSGALESINQALDNKNIKLKNIFNNVEQGFLTFGSDLKIQSEYSLECEKLFDKFITGETLSSLLNPKDINMQNFIDDLLTKIFNSDTYHKKIFIPLLPEEVKINNKVINLTYKVVKNEVNENIIMVIITDITEKRLLQKLMDEERSTLKMVVKIMMNRDELENKLYEKNEDFNINLIDSGELKDWLQEDLNILEMFVGKDFIKEGEIFYIEKEKLIEIEKKIEEVLSLKESRVILPLIKSLRYKSVKELLKIYPDYVMQLSERLCKNISSFDITGDDVMIDTSNYQDVFKSIVHIFRNSVDHGIEMKE